MRTTTRWNCAALMAGVLGSLLAACGGSSNPPAFIPQYGVTERQVYEPVRNASGIVVQNGSGAVSLQLESSDTLTPLPMSGDTATPGVDSLYFDILKDGRVNLSLSVQDMQYVASVEVRNAAQELLLKVDADSPQGSVWLRRGDLTLPMPRFQVRITSANGAVKNPHLLAWFGHNLASTANKYQLGNLPSNLAVQCEGCNLSGAFLGQYRLSGAHLPNADLRNAWLVKVKNFDALLLKDFQIFKLFMNSSQIIGSDLSGANLNRVDLTGAVLTGAGDSRADLTGTNLNYATITGINLDGAAMAGVQLNHVQAFQVSWVRADLTGAQMTSANLSQGNFEQANFTGANLSDADLRGSNLRGSIIEQAGVQLSRAKLTGAVWTDGRVCANDSVGECR
jgi:uncharacterized protein YjbI with pentapeptide repeats